jgi:hypothetical protein
MRPQGVHKAKYRPKCLGWKRLMRFGSTAFPIDCAKEIVEMRWRKQLAWHVLVGVYLYPEVSAGRSKHACVLQRSTHQNGGLVNNALCDFLPKPRHSFPRYSLSHTYKRFLTKAVIFILEVIRFLTKVTIFILKVIRFLTEAVIFILEVIRFLTKAMIFRI